jgi:magnesium chelatase subunit I
VRRPETLGQLKATGYRPRSVKDEIRENLLTALRERRQLFPGILGYEETVVPRIVNALLSRHDVLLLGLRGQAKSRILRALADLLDEATPVVRGS